MTPEQWKRRKEIGFVESYKKVGKKVWKWALAFVALVLGLVLTLLFTPEAQKIADWIRSILLK